MPTTKLDWSQIKNKPVIPASTVFNIADYGAVIDGVTDDSAAVLAAIAAAGVNGGIVFFPPGTCLINSQLTFPNTGGALPRQKPIKLMGTGASWTGYGFTEIVPYGGSILDLRYDAGPKILTQGAGNLEIAGLTLSDGGNNSAPFLKTTNTTLFIHNNAILGNPTKNGAGCDQDALILGGALITQTGSVNDPFQGYGTVIQENFFDRVRRAIYMHSWANGVIIRDNTIWISGGGPAAIESLGNAAAGNGNYGGIISGNLIEMFGYTVGIKLEYSSQFTMIGNNFYDPFGGVTTSFVELGTHTFFNYVQEGFDDASKPFCSDLGVGGNTVITTQPGGITMKGSGVPGVRFLSTIVRWEDSAANKIDVMQGFANGTDGVFMVYDRTQATPRVFTDTRLNVGTGGVTAFPATMTKGLALAEGLAPTAAPSVGFVLYVDPADHKLKARGASGTITSLANP